MLYYYCAPTCYTMLCYAILCYTILRSSRAAARRAARRAGRGGLPGRSRGAWKGEFSREPVLRFAPRSLGEGHFARCKGESLPKGNPFYREIPYRGKSGLQAARVRGGFPAVAAVPVDGVPRCLRGTI